MVGVTTRFGKRATNPLLERKGKKESKLSQMGDVLKVWAETSKAKIETSQVRTEVLLARVEKYKSGTNSEATSASTNDFSITRCMAALQTIELLNNDKYLKVIEKFTTLEWREICMNKPNERKNVWLDRL